MLTRLTRMAFVGIILIHANSFSQTTVNGLISSNTTWNLSGSPYVIAGNTQVDSGFTLTIDPGVMVKFTSQKTLQISGALRAIGTSVNPITFTSNLAQPAPGDWKDIQFNEKSIPYHHTQLTGSIMEYCIVENAGALQPGGAVSMISALPKINHCTFRNNLTCGLAYYENSIMPAPLGLLSITNCQVYNNVLGYTIASNIIAGGINVCANQANVIIENNKVENNTGPGCGGINLWINNLNWSIANNMVINNTATQSYGSGGGILVTGGSTLASAHNNLVFGNRAAKGGGIYIDDVRVSPAGVVSNNIVVKNHASIEGGGIYFSSSNYLSPTFQVTQNSLIENTAPLTSGIYLPNSTNSSVTYNTITRNSSYGAAEHQQTVAGRGSLFNYNNLYGNSGNAPVFIEFNDLLASGTLNNLNAKNCWWGTTSTSTINTLIWDYFDLGALSIVTFTPILTGPDITAPIAPPVNVIKTDLGAGEIQITWNGNTESDLTGYKIHYGSPSGYSFAHSVDVGSVLTYTLSGASINDSIALTAYDSQMDNIEDQFEGHQSWYTYATGKRTPAFSALPTTVCPNDRVDFTANTPETYPYAQTSWSWSFPGGTPALSSTQNPKITYATSGVYDVKLKVTNIAGSDSITLSNYITVNSVSYATLSKNLCSVSSYKSPSGLYTWYDSGVYHDTIPNKIGCDSILTLNLQFNNNSYATIYPTGCNSYRSPSGKHLWTTSDWYHDTIPNQIGCDSIIDIDLTIYKIELGVTVEANTVTANATGLDYQWLNCGTDYSVILGANNQLFMPVENGSYAVKITQNSCIDTSACVQVNTSGIKEIRENILGTISPNPGSKVITITIDNFTNSEITINIYDIVGLLVRSEVVTKDKQQIQVGDLSSGLYMIELQLKEFTQKQKFIIQRE